MSAVLKVALYREVMCIFLIPRRRKASVALQTTDTMPGANGHAGAAGAAAPAEADHFKRR